jgi:hypothetical protein
VDLLEGLDSWILKSEEEDLLIIVIMLVMNIISINQKIQMIYLLITPLALILSLKAMDNF